MNATRFSSFDVAIPFSVTRIGMPPVLFQARHAASHAAAHQVFLQLRKKLVSDFTRLVAHGPSGRCGLSGRCFPVGACDHEHEAAVRGVAAVELRHLGIDIPLILITGELGDERAVECVKAGAADYLLKTGSLARLPLAIKRAVEEKRARAESRRSHQLVEQAQHEAREQEQRRLRQRGPARHHVEAQRHAAGGRGRPGGPPDDGQRDQRAVRPGPDRRAGRGLSRVYTQRTAQRPRSVRPCDRWRAVPA